MQWCHPELGTFQHEDDWWEGKIELPAFNAFRYTWHGEPSDKSNIDMFLQYQESIPSPSDECIHVALTLVANQNKLVEKIVEAVWNDLQGTGLETGLWWHGDLQSCDDGIMDCDLRNRLQTRESLFDLVGGVSIQVRDGVHQYRHPNATIGFDAAFDLEHGVGILTDGESILGIGHGWDPLPFKL